MSHVETRKSCCTNLSVLAAVCRRMNMDPPQVDTFELFSKEVTGIGFKLPGWSFPVVINPQSGEVSSDNYGGKWGDISELDKFLQLYPVEAARMEAESHEGWTYQEESLPNGEIQATISIPDNFITY